MSRIRIELPAELNFTTTIPIRITDLNYGGHVGNDSILSLLHEARMQFLRHHGYGEMDLEGVALIMSDVGIEFKSEAFYGDILTASVGASDFSSAGFSIYYHLKKGSTTIAIAKTGMVCFNYQQRKVMRVPLAAIQKLATH